MPDPPRVVHLDELEAIPGPGSLTWRPVRLTLDLRAFGCNAYTADRPGDDVVEPHSEREHQELYFVAAGRAVFTIDGGSYDAPSGTYVFVPDPASDRHAIAAEPGTTVLSFGGPPTFVPSAWEWAFRATPLIGSNPARARAILNEGLELHPDAIDLRYNLACLEARQGESEAALSSLRAAIALRPEAREWARDDPDFASLHGDQAFRDTVGPGDQSASSP